MPIEFTVNELAIDDSFNWNYASLEGVYRYNWQSGNEPENRWSPYIRYGLNYHAISILELDILSKTVEFADNTFWALGLGVGLVKVIYPKIHLDLSVGYQRPLISNSSINTYKFNSGNIFDLVIETGYKLTQNSNINFFLNSIFFQTDYNLESTTSNFSGTQKLWNNILGINYGYSF